MLRRFTHPHAYDTAAKLNCSPIIISWQYTLATSAGCQWKCSQVNLNKPRGAVTVEINTFTAESWASLLLEYCVLASEKGGTRKGRKVTILSHPVLSCVLSWQTTFLSLKILFLVDFVWGQSASLELIRSHLRPTHYEEVFITIRFCSMTRAKSLLRSLLENCAAQL